MESEVAELIIQPTKGWLALNFQELLHYRELLYFLVWRDLKVRYKQTSLGVAWAVLQPLLNMLIFTAIFGRLAGIKSDGDPYPVFVFAGLLPWMFFSNAVSQGGQSLVNQQHLLTKVYFPRLFVPLASVGGGLVDLLISLGVYGIVLAWYLRFPSWGIVFLPVLIVLTVIATSGVSVILAALTVSYRDFRFVIPFMIQVWMYLSPVIYPLSAVPKRFQLIYALNPMAGVIDAYRASILGTPLHYGALGMSVVLSVGLFVFGMFYFRKTERRFADIA